MSSRGVVCSYVKRDQGFDVCHLHMNTTCMCLASILFGCL